MTFHKPFLISIAIILALYTSVSATTPPNSPRQTAPPHNATWSDDQAIPPGNITFTWQNNGDAESNPLWFYFYLIKWSETSWQIHTASYASGQGITTITQNLPEGDYAWQVAAVDASKSSVPFYSWADRDGSGTITSTDWSQLRVKGVVLTDIPFLLLSYGKNKSPNVPFYVTNKTYIQNAIASQGFTIRLADNQGNYIFRNFTDPKQTITSANLSNDVDSFKTVGTGSIKHIWFKLYCINNDDVTKGINWADTDANWVKVLNNIGAGFTAAKDMGIAGVYFDCESYGGGDGGHLNYTNLERKFPGCGGIIGVSGSGRCDNAGDAVYGNCNNNAVCERDAWKAEVKKRAKQIIQRAIADFGPNLEFGFRQGLKNFHSGIQQGCDVSTPGDCPLEFIPAMMNGFLEGLSNGALLIDFDNGPFNWKKGVVLKSDFDELWDLVKPIDGIFVNNAIYVEPGNKTIYNTSKKTGARITLDGEDEVFDTTNPGYLTCPGGTASGDETCWTNVTANLNLNTYTPEKMRTWLQFCKSTDYDFFMCFLYTNRQTPSLPEWFTSNGINDLYRAVLNDEW